MAGNRTNGLFNFAGNFEPQISSPLDARAIVPTQADWVPWYVSLSGLLYSSFNFVIIT